MAEWGSLGKGFIIVGLCVALVGLVLLIAGRVQGLGSILGWIGKLPGDISIQRKNFSFFLPLATSAVISIILSLVFYFVTWIIRR
ncbi:MAG: DUF2905 domain-containing protein [Nitrospira sp.]|nr:DUF2905 domain-containing protein [Nitrospira sp.]